MQLINSIILIIFTTTNEHFVAVELTVNGKSHKISHNISVSKYETIKVLIVIRP
jgi:hypothetical protein